MKKDIDEKELTYTTKKLKDLIKEGNVLYHFRGEIKNLSDDKPKIKVYIATIIDTKPISKGGEFYYKIKNYCTLDDNEEFGGNIDMEIISPKNLKKKEIISITEGSYHSILGFINTNYSMIEDRIKEDMELFDMTSRKSFLGLGELKINWNGENLTKEEFFQEQLKEHLILNITIPAELDFNNLKIKKNYHFENFRLIPI